MEDRHPPDLLTNLPSRAALIDRMNRAMRQGKKDRGYRFAMNEAGALTQNLQLTAIARGLGGCTWGGFCDEVVAKYVGADGTREIAVLGFVLGKRNAMGKPSK